MDLQLDRKLDDGPRRKKPHSNYKFTPKEGQWYEFVLHRHLQKKIQTRVHWDLRIEVPLAGGLRSFAIPKYRLPVKGKKGLLFIETGIHPIEFLDFEKSLQPKMFKGRLGLESISIIDRGKYFVKKATKDNMVLVFRGKIAKGTFYFRKTPQDNWWVHRYRKEYRPKMNIVIAATGKNIGSLSQILRHWRENKDKEWKYLAENHPELYSIQKTWRGDVHDFWQHQSQYSHTFASIQSSSKRGLWREDDLWMLKQEFFDPSQPAGQLMIKVKRGIEKESNISLKIAKELKLRQSSPEVRLFRKLQKITLAVIWRLLVVLMFDQPHLLSWFDQQAAGKEWEEMWSKMGILGKKERPK